MSRFVYFAQGCKGTPIKVGISRNPVARVKQLSGSSPEPLRLIAMFPGTLWDERELHDDLHEYRLHGEWFEDAEPVRVAATLEGWIRLLMKRVATEEVAKEMSNA